MKVVPKKFGATLTAVAIKNGKELDLFLRLFGIIGLEPRLLEIEHDRNPIFIVVPENAIMRICPVGHEIRRLRLL